MRKAVDQKERVLFETTLATGATPSTFAKAAAEARRQIAEEREGEFVYALDIRQARGRGIHPIAQQGAASVAAGPEEIGPLIVETPPELGGFDFGLDAAPPPETAAERIELWKRKLLDLSKRNRLLNLRDSATAIPIFCPDPARLEDRITAGRRITIIPPPGRLAAGAEPPAQLRLLRTGDDLAEQTARDALDRDQIIGNIDAKSLERGVIELFRKAKADVEEGGSNKLFLALGSLRWRPIGETMRSYRAPLILLPVRLERRSAAAKPYLTSHDDDPEFSLTWLVRIIHLGRRTSVQFIDFIWIFGVKINARQIPGTPCPPAPTLTLMLPGLSPIHGRTIEVRFDAPLMSSDVGLLMLRETEQRTALATRLADCIIDPRAPERIMHGLDEIIRFHMPMITAGWRLQHRRSPDKVADWIA